MANLTNRPTVNDEFTLVQGVKCDCCNKVTDWHVSDIVVKEKGEWDSLLLHRYDLLYNNVGNFEDIQFLVICGNDDCRNYGRYYQNDNELDTFFGAFGHL